MSVWKIRMTSINNPTGCTLGLLMRWLLANALKLGRFQQHIMFFFRPLCHQSVFFKGYGAPIRSNSVFNQIMVHHFLWRNVIPPVGLKKTWGINWSLWGKMLGALSQYRAQAFLRRMIQSLAEMGEQPWWGGRLRPHTTIKNIFHMSSFRKKTVGWCGLH